MSKKPVCLVLGAGAGIGGHVGRKFAANGYHAVLARRSDEAGLQKLVAAIESDGGAATGKMLNAVEDDAIENLVAETEKDIGAIKVAVFNLGAQIGNRPLAETELKTFTLGWKMACFALFRLAKVLLPQMAARDGGALLVTSSTAARRGNAGQHSHAAAMGGRRMLCQSLNTEFAPQGVHVAHIVVDGSVDAPDTLGRMLGDKAFADLRASKGGDKDGLLLPEKMAQTYYHIAHQHRSAWSHEIDLRPFSETAWWNSTPKPYHNH